MRIPVKMINIRNILKRLLSYLCRYFIKSNTPSEFFLNNLVAKSEKIIYNGFDLNQLFCGIHSNFSEQPNISE